MPNPYISGFPVKLQPGAAIVGVLMGRRIKRGTSNGLRNFYSNIIVEKVSKTGRASDIINDND